MIDKVKHQLSRPFALYTVGTFSEVLWHKMLISNYFLLWNRRIKDQFIFKLCKIRFHKMHHEGSAGDVLLLNFDKPFVCLGTF